MGSMYYPINQKYFLYFVRLAILSVNLEICVKLVNL